MTKLQRFGSFLVGLAMMACGVALWLDPKNGLFAVALVLSLSLVLYGLRALVYYLTMTRHMAGGLSLLFIAVVALDIGAFALVFLDNPKLSIVLFLVGHNAYTGVLAIARGIESRLFKSHWVMNVLHGLVNLALAAACVAFVGSDEVVIAIFCIGLFYAALTRIASAFQPTEIIYIQ